MFRLVLWLAFVCFSTHGFPHGGRVTPVTKRSDYSMYDNQFFSVGDTPLDNEVTDCALVRHQYARGFIRLREYLERMQGCGRKGKMANIAGIAASTKDAMDIPSNGPSVQKTQAIKTAPFKPRPIGEVIEKTDHKTPQISAYQNQGLNTQLPIQQHSVQRTQTSYNNFGFFNQENGPLSYSPNPATNSVQSPLARKLITKNNMNIPQAQALHNLATKNQDYPDPQRYYSDQTAAMAHPAHAGSVVVGQPVVRPNPNPLAYHQQFPLTTGITRPGQPQADQPVNPDMHVNKVNQLIKNVISHSAVQPVKQTARVQSGKIRDDIGGGHVYDEGVQDEANEAEIDDQESDPLPPETSFTYNPRLEEEDSSKKEDAKIEAENSNPYNLPNNPGSTPFYNSVPGNTVDQGNNDDISKTPIPDKGPEGTNKVKTSPQKTQDTQSTEQKSKPLTNKKPQNSQTPAQNKPKKLQTPTVGNPAGKKNDDLQGNTEPSNKLDDFLRPASSNDIEKSPQSNSAKSSTDEESQSDAAPSKPKTKSKGLAINLGVLKNRISNSRDIGFLKRMLSLIKKITHHKDFNKLGGVQKDAIVEAGKAVHNAVAKNADTQRSFIQPRPSQTRPDDYAALGYVSPSYADNSGVQNNAQAAKSFIQTHPPKWNPGDYTGQNYASSVSNYAYSGMQFHPPHWKPGDYTTGSTNAQVYSEKQSPIYKKFQIERKPYYQAQVQRPAAYQPSYFSLQRLNYGLYNGNVP